MHNTTISHLRSSPTFPAVVLIFIQLLSGMCIMPQLAFFLIYLQEELLLAPVTISTFTAGSAIAGMAAALTGGAVAGRMGSKWVIVCGLGLLAVSSFAFQAALPWAALLWMIGGVGLALTSIGGASYLTRVSAGGSLGILAAIFALSMTAGGAVGNPIAGVVIERYGFTAYSWFVIALAGIAILTTVFVLPYLHDRTANAVSVGSLGAGLLSTARQPNVRMLIGMRILPTIFYGILMMLVPLLLNDLSGSKLLVAAYGTTTLVVASAAQLLAGRAADRWGAKRPALVAYTSLLISAIGLAVTAGTVWGLFAFGVLGIATAWSLATLMFVNINDGVPKNEHPSTFGLLHAVWSVSMITGQVLGGWFVTTLPGLPFVIAGLINIGSFFLVIAYYKRLSSSGASSDDSAVLAASTPNAAISEDKVPSAP